jgi:glutamate formiminotransferase/formiminotetrahydrofolate cyclodeaminase
VTVKIVECVPNFSEGRDAAAITSITDAIGGVEGVTLLDVDPGQGANRTVVTFVGPPEAVEEAAFRAVARASEVIDMSLHQGSHARIGATDVCPFVPVSDVSVEECVEMARRVGRRVGEELSIPVYLYELAATSEARRNLADIRAGEYEGLEEKLRDPAWKPDFGPATFSPRSGATVIGVRRFLVAYNLNLNSDRVADARDLALSLREKGRLARDAGGEKVPDGAGGWKRVAGLLRCCKAVGWYIPEYGRAQISMNLTDHEVTGMHDALEAADRLARERGLRVTGSEIVGLVPLSAILDSGRFYLERRGASRGVPDAQVIRSAVQSLGLSDVAPFDPAEKVLELRLAGCGLVSRTVADFTAEVSTDSPAPGGGSVAALAGSLCAALVSMVANLTFAKEGSEAMEDASMKAQDLRKRLLDAVDRDTEAFNRVMAAFRLPRKGDEEKRTRKEAIAGATKGAARVPLEVMQMGVEALELALLVAEKGNRGSITDAGVAGLMGRACVAGAHYNVLINLRGLGDDAFVEEMRTRSDGLRREAEDIASRIDALLEESLR